MQGFWRALAAPEPSHSGPPAPPFSKQHRDPRHTSLCVCVTALLVYFVTTLLLGDRPAAGAGAFRQPPLKSPLLGRAPSMTGFVGVFEQPREKHQIHKVLGVWPRLRVTASQGAVICIPALAWGRGQSPHTGDGISRFLGQIPGQSQPGFSPSNAPSCLTTNEPQTRNYSRG